MIGNLIVFVNALLLSVCFFSLVIIFLCTVIFKGVVHEGFGFTKKLYPSEFPNKSFQLRCTNNERDRLDVISFDMEMNIKEPSVSTTIMNFEDKLDPFGASSTPIYQTATFKQPCGTECGSYAYSRKANPTRDMLERLLPKLDKANRAFCFSKGVAALSAVTHLVGTGQEVVSGNDMYGGSDRLLSQVLPGRGVVVKRVDMTDLSAVAASVGPWTKLVWLESPTNPDYSCKSALVLVDNSTFSSVLSRPLEIGADTVMHSATKFIYGHFDVMAGVLAVKGESLAKEIAFLQIEEGAVLAPFDCWVCLRGNKTMALCVEKQQENAQKIAEFLAQKKVNYAGLPDHPGRSLHYSQAKGAGSVLSFVMRSVVLSKHIVETTKYFNITVSFGSVKWLISLPCFMSHSAIPAADRAARGLTENLIRISVGFEDVNDLIDDLDYAIRTGPI
ncbi:hypothetical protein MKX01_035492 [Papaver californicum]|nr:hypothetical protein MKX01_035492 [Papaver californicum]